MIFRILKYQLYLLQLENYELGRFWMLLFKKGLMPKKDQRKDLVWTKKAVLIFVIAVLFHVLATTALVFYKQYIAATIFFLVFIVGYFIFYSVATMLLWPVDYVAKHFIIGRAKSKIKSLTSKLTIIGIAGSYGKTTMKEVLNQVLGAKFNVLATPDSVNTPVGISRWILNKVDAQTQILIVEMGEHYRGDIADICKIVKPNISIVTGINESHLERMGTLQNITETIFEIIIESPAKTLVLLNGDDKNVMRHYKEYVWPDHKIEEFRVTSYESRIFDIENLCWKVQADEMGEVKINLLGEYALADVDAAIKIGKSLGMSAEKIKQGIANIKPVSHRLQPIVGDSGVLVIDDAYNGNPEGVKEAIKVLSRFTNRRKVFITPGLVEMGKASAEVHRQIGKDLVLVADVVVLIKNSVTPFIQEGLSAFLPPPIEPAQRIKTLGEEEVVDNKFYSTKQPQIIWFNTAQEAHSSLGKILKPGDVVVFQNDWGDQYI